MGLRSIFKKLINPNPQPDPPPKFPKPHVDFLDQEIIRSINKSIHIELKTCLKNEKLDQHVRSIISNVFEYTLARFVQEGTIIRYRDLEIVQAKDTVFIVRFAIQSHYGLELIDVSAKIDLNNLGVEVEVYEAERREAAYQQHLEDKFIW